MERAWHLKDGDVVGVVRFHQSGSETSLLGFDDDLVCLFNDMVAGEQVAILGYEEAGAISSRARRRINHQSIAPGKDSLRLERRGPALAFGELLPAQLPSQKFARLQRVHH